MTIPADVWTPLNWPDPAYCGDALDLSVKAGGVFSMRRFGARIKVGIVGAGSGVVTFSPSEALQVAESLLAAVALTQQDGSDGPS